MKKQGKKINEDYLNNWQYCNLVETDRNNDTRTKQTAKKLYQE